MSAFLSEKPKVVIDTNIWISGLIFGGMPQKIIKLFISGSIIVIASEETLSELRQKINHKFPLFTPQLRLLEASIRDQAIIVRLGRQPINISRDSDDNKFIETAIEGEATYIISGDKDLLTIGGYENIKIIKPADFISKVN